MSGSAREPVVTAERRTGDGVELDLEVPLDLAWCRGHFPGFPVIPGVVLVHWAVAQGHRLFATAAAAPLALKVKFRRPIRPGTRLALELAHGAERRRLRFAYRDGADLCASGQITFAP